MTLCFVAVWFVANGQAEGGRVEVIPVISKINLKFC